MPTIAVTSTNINKPTTIDTDITSTTPLPECTKSPILSQPKTIRFPANGSRRFDGRASGCCYWDDCNEDCETSSNLLDHLQTKHVNSQAAPFSCRWANCKVHGRESCSRKWLERHVLSHGGTKLFKCIFDKCRMRFGSQVCRLCVGPRRVCDNYTENFSKCRCNVNCCLLSNTFSWHFKNMSTDI